MEVFIPAEHTDHPCRDFAYNPITKELFPLYLPRLKFLRGVPGYRAQVCYLEPAPPDEPNCWHTYYKGDRYFVWMNEEDYPQWLKSWLIKR